MAAKLGIHGLSRGIALDMARYNVRSNAIAPSAWSRMIGSIPTETDAEKQRVERLKQMTPEKIAPLAVYLGSDKADGISGQIFGVRNNEIFLFNAAAPDAHAAPLGRLDAGEARRAAQGRLQAVAHAAGALRRRVRLGPGLMAHRLRQAAGAEDSRRRAHLHGARRDLLRAEPRLRAGPDERGPARVRAREMPRRSCRRFRSSSAQSGFWARELETGIDWVKIVHGEHDVVIHKPLPASRHRHQQDRIDRRDRQGGRQGRADHFAAQDLRQSERRPAHHHHADDVRAR